MKLLISLLVVIFLTTGVFAQRGSVTVEADFSGATQPTVIRLPLPKYPQAAKRAKLGGRVAVAVTVNEQGRTQSADADGVYPFCPSVTDAGVSALRLAAIDAAKHAVFKPAVIGSQPILTSGRIIYSFDPGPEKTDGDPGVRLAESDTPARVQLTDRMTIAPDRNTQPGGADDKPAVPKPTGPPSPGTVSHGALNQKAVTLPKPVYPGAARAVHAGGPVSVRVLISEDGNMFSAEAITGHYLLRHSSEIAACRARFVPTLLSGHPVKVSGVIVYNYVP